MSEPVHEDAAHGGGHGQGNGAAHGQGHDHDEAVLGPIDTAAWGASLLGVAAGLLVCFLLYLAVT